MAALGPPSSTRRRKPALSTSLLACRPQPACCTVNGLSPKGLPWGSSRTSASRCSCQPVRDTDGVGARAQVSLGPQDLGTSTITSSR
uniref:Putative secreted protein n=1 Tax=Ixodes ricinus TaxID=34613 RepID=A0A6B0TZ35_IXORI